jgi:hypothetical protein
MTGFGTLLQALETISWPQAMVTIGLALNTTLSALLLQKRANADRRDSAEYYKMNLRLIRIERALENCPELDHKFKLD